MNSETKAIYDALAKTQGKSLRVASNFDSNKDQLLADLRLVLSDAETLVREAAGASNERFAALHTQFEMKLAEAKSRLGKLRASIGGQAHEAAGAAKAYVKSNPWQSAGIMLAVAALAGFWLARQAADADSASRDTAADRPA